MSSDVHVSDGEWHNVTLWHQHGIIRLLLDDGMVGDELDGSSVHDFLDPYLTKLTLGGAHDQDLLTNDIIPGKTDIHHLL